jgi:hypothetical protein
MDNIQPTESITISDDLILDCKYVSETSCRNPNIVVGCKGCVLIFGSFDDVPLSRWEGFTAEPPLYNCIENYDDDDGARGYGSNYSIIRVGKYIKIELGGGGGRNGVSNETEVILRASEFIPLLRENVKKLSTKGVNFTDYYKYEDELFSVNNTLIEWTELQKGEKKYM